MSLSFLIPAQLLQMLVLIFVMEDLLKVLFMEMGNLEQLQQLYRTLVQLLQLLTNGNFKGILILEIGILFLEVYQPHYQQIHLVHSKYLRILPSEGLLMLFQVLLSAIMAYYFQKLKLMFKTS